MTQSGPVLDRSTWEGQSHVFQEPSVFGNEILTILLALVIELFYIQRVTNVFLKLSLGTWKAGTCWLEGASGHGCLMDLLLDIYLL
uniref:Uncharacterized protein n=1 Tax=Helianthus annuus TaxID=4232 RepID=A0A251U149_HELAN